MTKFVVDAGVLVHLAAAGMEVSPEHNLLAPTLVRSEVLSALHEAVVRREISADVGLARHTQISQMPIRLLGDAVLRRRAWRIADQLGWDKTFQAEYVALTQLQGEALVTMDEKLAREVAGLVPIASIDALRVGS